MKDKIIIHNYTDLPDNEVLLYILPVVEKGKISKRNNLEQYCFVTTFKNGITVCSGRRNNTYTFKIEKRKE
jgi:hypothetical protein